MTTALLTTAGILLLALLAAVQAYRSEARQRADAERERDTKRDELVNALAMIDELNRRINAAAIAAHRERDAADARVAAEREAARSAAAINARVSSPDVNDVAAGLGDALGLLADTEVRR